jgi:general nucleoside transport system ATP-binding protein
VPLLGRPAHGSVECGQRPEKIRLQALSAFSADVSSSRHDGAGAGSLVLELKAISKRFGRTLANDSVTLTVHAGEVLGLLGENGAGKTTLMSIACGVYRPDSGQVIVDGSRRLFRSPRDALDAGVCMVHQHFSHVPTLGVTANIALSAHPRELVVKERLIRRRLEELAARYGLVIPADARVGDLSVGEQQRVEVVKALYRDPRVLILDEPTSALSYPEARDLSGVIRELAAERKAIIFISHKLDEIIEISDRIAVMRGGKLAAVVPAAAANPPMLARLMVGESATRARVGDASAAGLLGDESAVDRVRRGKPCLRSQASPRRDLLRVAGATVADARAIKLRDLDFEIQEGEIFGIVGLEGSGQRELAELVAGLRKPLQGRILLDGRDIVGVRPDQIASLGVGFIPEDRQASGLVLALTVQENLLLRPSLRAQARRWGLLNRTTAREAATQLLRAIGAETIDLEATVGLLSGGNQQRVVLARELGGDPSLIIAAEPTRGLDFAGAAAVDSALRRHKERGAAVLLISSDLDELLVMSDRIGVLHGGRLVDVVAAGSVTRESLALMIGGQAAPRTGMQERSTV